MLYPPYNRAAVITKSDTVDLPVKADAVYVGGAGIVAAVLEDGSIVEFTAVAGQIIPIKVKRVNSTNTTATLMVALNRV